MFQMPPPTRFDLQFSVAGIPVRVHPLFWIIAILLGAGSTNLYVILVWIVTIFVSILVHELGHAFAFRRYGQPSRIVLYVMGGLTVPESMPWGGGYANVSLTPNQNMFISFAGPLAGFILAALTIVSGIAMGGSLVLTSLFGFIPFPMVLVGNGSSLLNQFFVTFIWVNIFWGLINLLPVLPLDGGNIARYALIQRDPWNGMRTSLWVSVITGGVVAALALLFMHSIYMAFLFGFLAFQSYQLLQGSMGRY